MVAHWVAEVVEAVEFVLDDGEFFFFAHSVGDGCQLAEMGQNFLVCSLNLVGEIKLIN